MPSVTHVFFVVMPVDVIYSLFFLNVFAASSLFAAKIMTIILIKYQVVPVPVPGTYLVPYL